MSATPIIVMIDIDPRCGLHLLIQHVVICMHVVLFVKKYTSRRIVLPFCFLTSNVLCDIL